MSYTYEDISKIDLFFTLSGKEYQPGTYFFLPNLCIHRCVLICVECKGKERNKLAEIGEKRANTPLVSLKNPKPGRYLSRDPAITYLDRRNPSSCVEMKWPGEAPLADDAPMCDCHHFGTRGKRPFCTVLPTDPCVSATCLSWLPATFMDVLSAGPL